MARKPKQSRSRSSAATPGTQAKKIASLQKRIKANPPRSLPSYWQLGYDARRIGEIPSLQFARALGIGDANLRQAIKFSERANSLEATQLEQAGIPWRGVVYWLGVKDAQQLKELQRRMLNGLKNSTAIRKYIEDNFQKPATPRRYASLEKMCAGAQNKAEGLAAALRALADVHAQIKASDPKAVRQVQPQLQKLTQTVKQVSQPSSELR